MERKERLQVEVEAFLMERYIYVVSNLHKYIDDTIHQQPLYRAQLAISLSRCSHDRFVITDAGLSVAALFCVVKW